MKCVLQIATGVTDFEEAKMRNLAELIADYNAKKHYYAGWPDFSGVNGQDFVIAAVNSLGYNEFWSPLDVIGRYIAHLQSGAPARIGWDHKEDNINFHPVSPVDAPAWDALKVRPEEQHKALDTHVRALLESDPPLITRTDRAGLLLKAWDRAFWFRLVLCFRVEFVVFCVIVFL